MRTHRALLILLGRYIKHTKIKQFEIARRAIEVVSNRLPVPQSGEEYGKTYVLEPTPLRNQLTEEIGERPTAAVRRMLRFYHQIGILIDKGLVDSDFVFALVGPGLVTSKHGIVVTCDWYQNHWAGSTGHDKGPYRPIYANALKLCEHYENSAKRNNRVL